MDIKYIIKEARYYAKLNGFSRAFKKFLLTQTPLRKIVNTPLYNRIYLAKIRKKAGKLQPKILQIENTNLCNAKCIMCPHVIMKRKGKIMKFGEFKKILDNVMKNYDFKRLTISGFGEPFVDKNIIEKIAYANEKYPKLKVDVYTNASLITKEITDRLLGTNIDRITFSINGTKKNYKKIMALDYRNTKKNVLYLLKEKKRRKHKVLTNMSLMILKENERDVKDFIDFWSALADSVRVYAPSDWAGSVRNIEKKVLFKGKRWPCTGLWNNITVDVKGNVIMCCRDYESKVKFGNLLKEDIKKIRNSEKFKELLERQLKFDFSDAICRNCDNSFDSSLDWIC